MQADERFAHRARQAVIQREPLAGPVAGSPQAAELVVDDPAVFAFPLPRPLDEFLTAEFFAGDLVLAQEHLLHLQLGGDPGVVRSGHPQRRLAAHALVAGHHVLD